MKKGLKFLLLGVLLVSLTGCFKDQKLTKSMRDNALSSATFESVEDDKMALLRNAELALDNVKGFTVVLNYEDTNKNVKVTGTASAILEETREDINLVADINVNGKRFLVYIKDGTVNISYPFKGINGGIRDSVDNIAAEVPALMTALKLEDKTPKNIDEFLEKSTFDGFELVEWFKNHNITCELAGGGYQATLLLNEDVVNITLDAYFRITNVNSSRNGKTLVLTVTYPDNEMTLVYPASLKGLTYFKVRTALNMAKADSLADLVK